MGFCTTLTRSSPAEPPQMLRAPAGSRLPCRPGRGSRGLCFPGSLPPRHAGTLAGRGLRPTGLRRRQMTDRWLGIDIGAETIKVVELRREGADLAWARRLVVEHHEEPGPVLLDLLAGLD